MGARLDTSQARALGARVAAAGGHVGALGSAVLRRTALAIEADAKSLAPVDTGALESSISSTFAGDGRNGSMSAEIGPTVEYGPFVEYGTSRMGAQPYMGPAYDRNVDGYLQAVAQLGEKALG